MFKNFIVVILLAGGVTRLAKYLFAKIVSDKMTVIYISSIASAVLVCSLAAVLVGFDVVVSEYLIAFIVWFVFDLLRSGAKK